MKPFKLSIIFISLFIISMNGFPEVEPPNYDFSVKKFDVFMPGQSLNNIEKQYKNKELVFKDDQYLTYKFYIEHIRYKFFILVQFQKGIVTDFHARLPQYFLHDIFHQSLIKKIGTQDIYKKKEEQAIYIWNNKNNMKHIYTGACTITCFPIYYSVRGLNQKATGEFKTILDRLEAKLPKAQP